jgi:hypothetical protein
MKRIINGVTYNTDTSTPVAKYEYRDDDGYDTEVTVYQTRGEAFFAVHRWSEDGTPKVHFEAMDRDILVKIINGNDGIRYGNFLPTDIEILNEEILAPPPEASAEVAPGATLYIRIPASLKGLSVNAWTMRCVERCAQMKQQGG